MKRNVFYSIIVLIILIAVTSGWYYFTSRPAYVVPQEVVQATADYQVTIDTNKVIGKNNLLLGFQIDRNFNNFWTDTSLRQLGNDANFKLVRFFEHRPYNGESACNSWNETLKRCTSWNWKNMDDTVNNIISIGAEPFIVLGFAITDGSGINPLPSGMRKNSTTLLPDPYQWAAYCTEFVKHFGNNVKYYEIVNEANFYLGWVPNGAKMNYFIELFNASTKAMRTAASQISININIGCDESNKKAVLGNFTSKGEYLDFLSFHRYGNHSVPSSMTDQQIFTNAETRYIERENTYSVKYLPEEAVAFYKTKRGKELPIIMSEGNLNSWFDDSANPRIDVRTRNIVGAVYTALSIRTFMLKNISYSVYFHYASNEDSIGMINISNDAPWYPYYAQKIIGSNLYVGDEIVNLTSSSSNMRALAWKNKANVLNILLIHNSSLTKKVGLQGVEGQFTYQKIDNTTESIQSGAITIDASHPITLNGYIVMLLNKTITTTCSDGTAYNSCSNVNKPSWCNSTGSLISNQCGSTRHNCPCPSSQTCNTTSGSCYQNCSDGTPYGQCNNSNKPKYCSSGTLIDKCSQCGCPTGQSCNTTTNSCYMPKCSDGTLYNQCSSIKPKYCSSGTLINKCSVCNCSSGYSCQSDGTCLSNLVSYWKFDENSGTKAYDYTKMNNGTLMNMETADWVTGKYGKALKFDGIDEYVDCGSKASLTLRSFSITAWINSTSRTGYKTIVRKVGSSSSDTSYALDLNSGDGKVRFFVYDTSGNYHGIMPTTNAIPLNAWTHISATYDGSTFKVYINGIQDSTTATWTGSIKSTTGSLKIGSSASSNYFNGTIDEVKIWNRSLTQEEITKVYNNQL